MDRRDLSAGLPSRRLEALVLAAAFAAGLLGSLFFGA